MLKSVFFLMSWWLVLLGVGAIDEDLYVERFELAQLPQLRPQPIEQNLAFHVGKTFYNFTLRPRNAIITSDTNISLIITDNRGKKTYPMNASEYTNWNFEGFTTGNSSATINGLINKQGQFEGHFVHNDSIYLVEPSMKYELDKKHKFFPSANNSIVVKVSDICRRTSKKAVKHRNGTNSSCPNGGLTIKACGEARRNVTVTNIPRSRLESVMGEMVQQKVSRDLPPPASTNVSYLCHLKVVLDYRFFKYVGRSDVNKSMAIVVSLLSKVDRIFRKIDLNEDGRPDNVGLYLEDLAIYKDPVKFFLNQTAAWDPIRFFQEMKEYDFSGACAGFLFTFREMQSTEEESPSLIKNQLVNEEQGICSPLKVRVPKASANDYGEFIANALPINFRLRGSPACENVMVIQVLHQLGHLFGAPNDDFYSEEDQCCKKMKGHTYAMAFPTPSGDKEEHSTYSPCSIMAMANYLRQSPRPCLRPCVGESCHRALYGMSPSPRIISRSWTKSETAVTPVHPSPTRDWTEYCFTVPRNGAISAIDWSSWPIEMLLFMIAFLFATY